MASFISPSVIRDLANTSSGYKLNRDRGAVMLTDAFYYWDTYQAVKPWLFAAGLLGMFGSGYALYKRKRRTPEVWATYLATFTASSGVAYVTRPAALWVRGGGETEAEAEASFVDDIDTKIPTYRAENPKFADKAYKRLVNMPGIVESWQATPDMVKALIL